MNPLSNNSNDVKWLSMSEASDHTPYSAEYLSLLARKGKLASKKINGVWYTTKSALDEYMQKQMLRAQVLGNSYPTPAQKLPEMQVVQAVPAAPTTPDEPALDASIYDEASLKKLRSFHADIRAYMEREGLPLPKEEDIAPARNTTDVLKLAEQDYTERTIAQEFLPNIPQKNVVADTLGAVRQETHAGIEKTLEKVLDKKLGGGTVQFGSSMASLPVLPRRSWKTVSASRMLLVATLILMVGLTTLPVPFVFSSFENAGSALKKWATDANTVMGFRPGTHKNELLLLDKDGNVAITGSVEAGGQLASYAADGVAPIIVTSKTQVNNLNAEFLNGASSTDFTLAFVTKNGSVTTEDVQLLGSVEVGKSLLVKGATKLLSSLAVDGDLAVFGNAEFNQALTVLGPARFKQLLAVEDNLTVGKNASIRGSLTVGRSVNAGSGTFTSLGTGDFSATGQVSLGASNKTLTVDAKNVSIDKDGNASFDGALTALTLNLTGSGTSTVAGPVVFNGSVSLQGSGTLASLSVTGSTTLADLLVTGSSSLQNLTFVDATGSSATTTNFFSSKLSSLLASISSLVADDISVGALTATSSVTTNATTTNATTTNMFAANASSTNLYSTYANTGSIVFGDATGTNATTTNLFSHIGTFDDVYVNNYQQNNGTFTINSTVPTGDIFSVFDTAITDGTLIHQSLTANAGNGEVSKGQIIDLVDDTVAGGGYSALTVNVTGAGVGSGSKLLLDLNPGANKEIVFDANGALRPTVDASQNITSIGTPSYYFKNGYFDTITANAISGTVITGSTASHTWTIGANETGDVNEAIIFQRNSGSGNALFQWNASNGTLNDQRFLSVNYPFNATYTINDSSIATSSSLYSGLFTNNTTSGTQKLLSLTNTGTGTTEDGIYVNNTGTGATGIEIAGTWTTGIKTNNNSINAGTGALSAGFATFANILATGSTTLQNFTAANSTTTNATTTNFFSTNASSTNLFFVAANGGTQTLSGLLTAANLLVTGSTSLQNFTFTNATGTNATTTNFYATNATLGNLSLTNLIFTNATGTNATTTNFYSTVASSTNLFSTTLAVGGDKLVVTSGGNVGIGITNPSSKLTVAGGDIAVTGSTNGITFANNQSIRDGGASGDLNLFTPTTGGAINLNTTNGNIVLNPGTMSVGIGTSTPKGLLQLARDVSALPNASTYGQLELTLTSNPTSRLSAGYSSTFDAGFLQAISGSVNKSLLLNPQGGSVGVGTTNPSGVLEVAFSSAITGGLASSNSIVVNNTNTTANNWAGTLYATLTSSGVGAIGASIGVQTTARSLLGVTSDLVFATSNNAGSPSEALRIKANGNVGVGTTTPTLSRLEVDQVTGASGGFDVARFINPSGNGNASGVYIQTTEGNAAGTYALRVTGGSGARNLLEVRNNGNIGIGTTTPNQLLTLYSATTPSINLSTGAGGAQWTAGIDTADAGKFKIASSTAVGTNTRLTIDGSGNVGFGTTTPVSIIAASASRPALTLSKSNTGQNWTMLAGANSSFYIKPNVPSADGTDSDYSLYIDTSSNAGIKGNLTVSGTGNSSFAGNVGIGLTNPGTKLSILGADGANQFTIQNPTNTSTRVAVGLDASDNALAVFTDSTGAIKVSLNSAGNTYFTGGNVGVGTTNPSQKLDVNGNIAVAPAGIIGSGQGYGCSGCASAGTIEIYNNGTGNMTLQSGTGFKMLLNPNGGNVGIGTTNPQALLNVAGNALFGGTNAGAVGNVQIVTNGASPINNRITYGTDGTGWKFAIGKNQGGTVTDQLTIQDNGNVGIGITNPTSLLSVGSGAGATAYGTPTTQTPVAQFTKTSGQADVGVAVNDGTNNPRIALFADNTTGVYGLSGTYSSGNAAMVFRNAGAEYMRITSTGNIGIGTTTPAAKLNVTGSTGEIARFEAAGSTAAAWNTYYQGSALRLYTGFEDTSGGGLVTGGIASAGVIRANAGLHLTAGSSATTGITVTTTGAVGVGTTSPIATFAVQNLNSATNGVVISGSSNTNYMLTVNNGGGLAQGVAINGGNTGSDANLLTVNNAANTANFFTVTDGNSYFQNGNVGIGITNPGNARLNIQGVDSTSGNYALFTQNGSNAAILVARNDGNVGIGTTAPQNKFTVAQSSGGNGPTGTDGSGGVRVAWASGYGVSMDAWDGSHPYWGIVGWNANTPTVRIGGEYSSSNLWLNPTGGNVGVGTTNPATKLEIDGAGQGTQAFNTGGAHGATLYLNDTAGASTNQGGAIMFGAADYRFAAIKGLLTNGVSNGQGDLQFLVRTSATDAVLTNALMIKASGAVGVGTTNPVTGSKLNVVTGNNTSLLVADVAGAGGDCETYNTCLRVSGAVHSQIKAEGRGGSGYAAGFARLSYDPSATTGWSRIQASGDFEIDTNVNSSTVRALTINTSGSVGIGKTNPGYPLDVNGNIAFQNQLVGNGLAVLQTGDTYLRINQSNQFSSGIWLGTSDLKMYTSTLRIGSNGGAGEVEISGTSGDGTTRVAINGNAGTGIYLGTGGTHLELQRSLANQNGISWYSTSYKSWSQYMAMAGQTGTGPSGALTAPSGSLVTSWALRSYVENSGGYGWTWESAADTATPSVMFEVSSNNGSIRAAGNGTFAGGTLTIGSGTINQAQSTYGTLALASAKNSYYGLLFGQSSSNPNMMFDSSGNGGVYYESLARWRDYYIPSTAHWNINTSTDLGATLGISGTLAVNNGDSSIATFGPNASWGAYLRVGAATNNIASGVAQVISTNGNLHLDAGTSQDLYLNYFSAGRPIHAVGPIDTAYNISGAGAPTSGYNFNIGSIGASTVYGYTAICTGNASGACNSTGGAVLGVTNTSAFSNFPNSGNSFVGGYFGIGINPSYNLHISSNSPTIMLSSANDDSRLYFTSTSLSIRGEPGQSLSFYTNASSRQAYFDPNGFHILSGGIQLPNLHSAAPTCNASNYGLTVMGQYTSGNTYGTVFDCGTINGSYFWTPTFAPSAIQAPDLAEYVPVQDDSIAAGEVVALSDVPNLAGSKPYDTFYAERASAVRKDKVLGVVSTNPGYILNEKKVLSDKLEDYAQGPDTTGLKPLALAGRVPVKVTTENGAVEAGDYITVSDTVPGAAMKMTTAGNAIGQALDNYDPATGTVLVLVGKTYFTNGISIEDLKNRMVAVENDIEMLKTVASSTAARIDTLETRVLALESASSTGLTFDATTTNPIVSGMLAVLGSTIIDGVTHFKDVVVAALTVGSHENPTGITIYDTATGNPYCFKVTNGATVNVPGKCGQETSTPSAPSAPVISSGTPDTTASSTSSTTASSTPSTDTASSTPTTDTASSTPSTDTAPSTSTDTSTATATSGTDTSTTASGTTTASASDAPTTTS